jgi:hypothetical protein
MNKSFTKDIDEINANIKEAEMLLRESMNFYEEDSIEQETEEMPTEDEFENETENNVVDTETNSVESYIDHIRKYSLNGLSSLCENPESEEYQMLKKIFQMCDKKPERKENMVESHRLFGVLKENKKVIFETTIENTKDFNKLKSILINKTLSKGFNPSDIRLVSENKIIR